MERIHSSAIIDPEAKLASDVEVGPFCLIGAGVEVGSGTRIGPYTRIDGPTRIGERNHIFGHSSIGTDPQDLKFAGTETRLEIGDDNTIREFATINRGTAHGGGLTRVGNHSFLMAYAHIAHDCFIGDHVIFANGGTLAGHVIVEDYALVGAFTMIHQFCRVGRYAFTGGGTVATQDVLPYVKTVGARPARTFGINSIGLERKGFARDQIRELKRAYSELVRSKLRLPEAVAKIREEHPNSEHALYMAEFAEKSERGFIR